MDYDQSSGRVKTHQLLTLTDKLHSYQHTDLCLGELTVTHAVPDGSLPFHRAVRGVGTNYRLFGRGIQDLTGCEVCKCENQEISKTFTDRQKKDMFSHLKD